MVTNFGASTIARPVSLNHAAGDGEDRTAACFQYVPTDFDGHFVSTRDAQAIDDWLGFLVTLIATGTPTVD